MDRPRTANIPSESWDELTRYHSILDAGTPDMYKEAWKPNVTVYKSKGNTRSNVAINPWLAMPA